MPKSKPKGTIQSTNQKSKDKPKGKKPGEKKSPLKPKDPKQPKQPKQPKDQLPHGSPCTSAGCDCDYFTPLPISPTECRRCTHSATDHTRIHEMEIEDD